MIEFPLVSVLIPCYNHEKYVDQALNSVVDNSYSNKEIVIIDDGSTDGSYEKIKIWASKNSHLIKVRAFTRENKGLATTLNELIELAAGEFLCLLASDDLLITDSIEKRIAVLLQNPDKLVVIGDAKVINTEGEVIMQSAIEDLYFGKKSNYLTVEGLKYSVINEWSIPGPVILVKKSLYNLIGSYPTNLLAEDLNFYLQVIGRELLIFVDEPVALYRVHDLNTCRHPSNKKRIVSSIIKSYFNNLRYFKGRNKIYLFIKLASYIRRYFMFSYINIKSK
ncbi:MAG: glycosyl transferase family 2 [Segetibacter sp.]|jgi:glycosyltransferase involved in cell wall biosynthesis|nr:glycosyl transferase family 2 [Segetibacter sp.]